MVPWLPARGDAVPGTGKQHLCNSLNSISPSHLAALGMQSLRQKQVPGGSFIRKVAMEVFEGFSMATGQCHCSRDAVTTVTITLADVLRLQSSSASQAPSPAHNAPVFQAQHG